jgi:hypothetical protein
MAESSTNAFASRPHSIACPAASSFVLVTRPVHNGGVIVAAAVVPVVVLLWGDL